MTHDYNALIRQIQSGVAFDEAFYEKIKDKKILRRYAAWNAAEALRSQKTPVDPRSWLAVKAAVQYADGKITSEELRAAYRAARSAASYAAADCAADYAADYAAAHSAARSAAYYAAASYAAKAIGGDFEGRQRSKLVAMLRGDSFTLEDLSGYVYFSKVSRALRGEVL